MTNEEYVTKILERVGPIIDVVGLFLVVKKIQEDEREECAKICETYTDFDIGNKNSHAILIRARGQE